MTRIDAVIVSWRSGPEIDRCLASLAEHAAEALASVTVVDSGSGDGTADAVAAAWPSIRVEALNDNVGFGAAANHGIACGAAQLALLLNPDTQVAPDAVSRLVATLDRETGAFGAAPLLIGPDGRTQHRWQLRRLPTVWRLATGRPGAPAFRTPPTDVRPVPQPAAAAWLIRRSRWAELGGFDPRFRPAWWEDVDLCARLAESGGGRSGTGFLVEPLATVYHMGGSSVPRLGRTVFLAAYHRNLLRYAAAHHPHRLPLIRATLRTVLAIRGRGRPELSAVREGLR
jgi:GT2 family glycosyltransferase